MKKRKQKSRHKHFVFEHRFVETIPPLEAMQDCVLYISLKYSVVSHRCACGCGQETVTPLLPSKWKLTFDGETVTLSPSIGNFEIPCCSHYYIRNSQVVWVDDYDKPTHSFILTKKFWGLS